MAGVKGMKGGGGARPGAGRKPKQPEPVDIPESGDPMVFLLAVMDDESADQRVRADAAKALLPYMHPKIGEGGKKEAKDRAAKAVGGKFAPAATPLKLVAR